MISVVLLLKAVYGIGVQEIKIEPRDIELSLN